MANRGDFFKTKLPRQYKRMLAVAEAYGWVKNSHERGDLRRAIIDAHASHVDFKMKRHTTENRDASDGE